MPGRVISVCVPKSHGAGGWAKGNGEASYDARGVQHRRSEWMPQNDERWGTPLKYNPSSLLRPLKARCFNILPPVAEASPPRTSDLRGLIDETESPRSETLWQLHIMTRQRDFAANLLDTYTYCDMKSGEKELLISLHEVFWRVLQFILFRKNDPN